MNCSYRPLAAFAVVLLIGFLVVTPNAKTAPPKGGGGGTPPVGKVHFSYSGNIWQMNADGSGKAIVNAPSAGVPSRQTYGGGNQRWWAVMSGGEVWATRNGTDYLQITNMKQRNNGDGTTTYVELNTGSGARLTWSNDGLDTFLSVKGVVYTEDADGQVLDDWFLAIYRLKISAAELELRFQNFLPGPAFTETQAERVVVSYFGYDGNFVHHDWSPDGTKILYVWRNDLENFGEADLWVADVGPDATLPVLALGEGVRVLDYDTLSPKYTIDYPQWSPQADEATQRIAFRQGPAIRTIRPDGSGLATLVSSSSGRFDWSPDGNHLVYRSAISKGFNKTEYQLYRIGAAGGTAVSLTGDLDRSLDKAVVGWSD